MNRRKTIFALAVVALAAFVIGGVIWLARSGPENPHWTLPDGTKLELVKVDYGPGTNQARAGSRLRDYFYPILPAKLQTRFGLDVATCQATDPAAIVLWFRRTGDKQSVPGGAVELAALDQNGLECRDAFSEIFDSRTGRSWKVLGSGALPVNSESVFPLELDNYPRRSGQIHMRVYYHGEKAGEFTLANRLQNHSPGWQPETLPATRKTNALEVRLVQLVTGLNRSGASSGGAWLEEIGNVSQAIMEFRENGQPATNWTISGIHLSAATGFAFDPASYSTWWRDAKLFLGFSGTLWSEEPAWKLSIRFQRISNFLPDEFWVVKSVPVPGIGETREVHAVTNVAGRQIELVNVRRGTNGQAVGTVKINPSPPTDGKSYISAALRVTAIKDEQGRSIERGSDFWRNGLDLGLDNNFFFPVTDFGDAKTVDITFAVPKEISVEFLAKPILAAPATNR